MPKGSKKGQLLLRVDARPCVLYVDVLGTKERWFREGAGPKAASRAFERFKDALRTSLDRGGIAAHAARGALTADGVAIRFGSVKGALAVGVRLFQECFEVDLGKHDRMWIRGVIAPCIDAELIEERVLEGWPRISSRIPTRSALEATIAEKSGFRGMRLLVEATLLDDGVRSAWRVEVDGVGVERFLSLTNIGDSDRVRSYEEVLWMLDGWPERRTRMERRLRLAGRDQSEFAQASATALTFARCDLRVQKAGRSR